MLKSPCCGECRLESGICRGCLRTVDEITRWPGMNEQEQETLLAALLRRDINTHCSPCDVMQWTPDDKSTGRALAICPQCGEPSGCAVAEGRDAQTCWCMNMPTVAITLSQTNCWCARCLAHQPSSCESRGQEA